MASSKQKTILIVEDEPELRHLLTCVFEPEQFKVFHAADGQEAIEIFKAHADEIVLLITDLGLPKIGGADVIARLKKLKPTLKVIAATPMARTLCVMRPSKAEQMSFCPSPSSC